MLHDWGSRDRAFIAATARVRARLVALAGGGDAYAAVPIQGSGTFAIEAMVGTLVPPTGKLLILVNGAYGERMARICRYYGRAHVKVMAPEDQAVDPAAAAAALGEDPAITHVAVVHCETTSGVLNPVAEVAAVVAKAGRRLLIDAMSAFGAIDIDAGRVPFAALAASSNKCLEGVPGLAFVIVRKDDIAAAAENAPSLSLDLHDQWQEMEKNGQWRFTPPTHVLMAFDRALDEHAAEGGVAGRGARYRANCRLLVEGMAAQGFVPLLPPRLQAPIIVTFRMPADPRFEFQRFYDGLAARGYVIYPGKLTVADSFRIGCIGRLGEPEIRGALAAVRDTLADMGVASGGPVRAAAPPTRRAAG
jgi:2-aminoethylphosphonate-pyruvate transaminase